MQGQTNLKRVENLIRKHFRCESNERIPNMLTRLNPQDLFQIWSFRFYCWWIKFGSPVEILVNVRLIHALHPVKFNSSPPKKGPTRLRGKHRLPIIVFQGRTVKFRGCNHLNWFRRNLPINSMLFLKFTHAQPHNMSPSGAKRPWGKLSCLHTKMSGVATSAVTLFAPKSSGNFSEKKMSSQNGKDQHVYFVLSSPRVSGEMCLIYHNPSRIPGFLGSPDERNFFQVKGGQSESNFGRSP